MNNYIKKILFIHLLLSPIIFHSQDLSVSGTVYDQKKTPLPGANVYIKHTNNGVLSDLNGTYFLSVEKGDTLVFSFLGMSSEEKLITKDTILNPILKPQENALEQVTLTARKPVLQAQAGKLIFNVQNSALTSGITSLQLIQKLPGISIGPQEEIFFKGTSGINVMINGEMTYLSGGQLSNYLKGLGAQDIDKIEVITSPTAEFDAAGSSGLINIILKRKREKGYAIDLRSAISRGKFWMTNQNVAASLNTDKINFYASFDYNTPHKFSRNRSSNTFLDNQRENFLNRNNESTYKIEYYTWRAGLNWRITDKHSLGINYHGYLDDFKSQNNSNISITGASNDDGQMLRSSNNIIEPYHYDAAGLKYTFDIDSLGQALSFNGKYISYRNYSDGLLTTETFEDGVFIDRELLRSSQPGFVKIISLKSDYKLPLNTFLFKGGIKFSDVENDNRYRFESFQNGSFSEIPNLSGHFRYRERIIAGYLSASKEFDKTTIEAGLRLEHTHAKGFTMDDEVNNKWKYENLFPSLSINRTINDKQQLGLSFSRRIKRPSYTDLNPVRWYTDQYFYYSGNPNLIPEKTWISELTYSLNRKYIFSASYSNSSDFINRQISIENENVIQSQSANFNQRRRFDLSLSTPFKLFPYWTINAFSDIAYTSYPISQTQGEKELSLWSTSILLQQEISLPKDYFISLSTNYFSPELRGIYRTRSAYFIDFGIKKSFLNDNLNIQFSVNDLFNTNRYVAKSQSDFTDYRYYDKPFSRIIGLSLKYHIGGKLIKTESLRTEEESRL